VAGELRMEEHKPELLLQRRGCHSHFAPPVHLKGEDWALC
jgi:hypothetical protein